jgi:hypothetical protein
MNLVTEGVITRQRKTFFNEGPGMSDGLLLGQSLTWMVQA